MHFLWNRTAIVRERPIAPRRAQKILSATFCRARIFAARPVSGHSTHRGSAMAAGRPDGVRDGKR